MQEISVLLSLFFLFTLFFPCSFLLTHSRLQPGSSTGCSPFGSVPAPVWDPSQVQSSPKERSNMESLTPRGIPSPFFFHMPPPVSSGREEISHYMLWGLGYSPESGCGSQSRCWFLHRDASEKESQADSWKMCLPPPTRYLFCSSCAHPGLSAHTGIQTEGSEGISTL